MQLWCEKMVEWELYYLTWQMVVYMPVGMYICLCRCTCIMDKILEDRMLTEFFFPGILNGFAHLDLLVLHGVLINLYDRI